MNVSVVRFKFHCNILISGKIIKEKPGSVASGTPCTILPEYGFFFTWIETCGFMNFKSIDIRSLLPLMILSLLLCIFIITGCVALKCYWVCVLNMSAYLECSNELVHDGSMTCHPPWYIWWTKCQW
jgi:hypothetical protein